MTASPEPAPQFAYGTHEPMEPRIDPTGLTGELRQLLERFQGDAASDPYTNPILRLALDISRRIGRGELELNDLSGLIQHLTGQAFAARAARLGRYFGETDPQANRARLRQLFEQIAKPDGETADFETYRDRLESVVFGAVFTAHPTFMVDGELYQALARLGTGHDETGQRLDDTARAALMADVCGRIHRPDQPLDLSREQQLSIIAIENLQRALRIAYQTALEVARAHWPEQWSQLTPALMTVATWVGYDLDGRNDIRWTDVLHKRLTVQVIELQRLVEAVRGIRHRIGDEEGERGDDLRQVLELAENKLALAIKEARDEQAVFGSFDPVHQTDTEHLQRIAQRMHEGRALRLTDGGDIITLINRALRLADHDETRQRLCLVRAEIANYGLGLAHTHVRINAQQIHNSIRKAVELETSPEDPRYRKSYLAKINQLLEEAQPVSINFGTVMNERPSAKRLFMICRQILTYVDSATPIRFLIAETESAFTVLAALYYARLFGVEEKLEICPLFETERAIQMGSKIIDQLLENPHYRAYVERTGKLCIQTGYSDAGRYLGQTPAGGSIERLKGRVARLFEKHGLSGVQFIAFDTHGESIGRGGHPGGFAERFRYLTPARSQNAFAGWNLPYKQETTFQGGDGYVYFFTETGALAALTRILEYALAPPQEGEDSGTDDPYYTERDYVTEFFTTVKEFQVDLMEDPSYGALLSSFGPNLLYPTGSRALKRQHEPGRSAVDARHPSQIRAIPHNATLQQLGLLANSIGGVGEAIRRDPQDFDSLYRRSPRFRQIIAIARYGLDVSNADALHAYVDLMDPATWLFQAARAEIPARGDDMVRLARFLEEVPINERQRPVFRKLYRDALAFRQEIGRLGDVAAVPPDHPAHVGAELRTLLALLHALRIAIIQEIYLLGTRIPQFSSQHNTTYEQIVGRVLNLDIIEVMQAMERIFPATGAQATAEDYGEIATYVTDDTQDYSQDNRRIFQPMRALYEQARRITSAITHCTGFIG